jgi:hypothetical protein
MKPLAPGTRTLKLVSAVQRHVANMVITKETKGGVGRRWRLLRKDSDTLLPNQWDATPAHVISDRI